MIATLDRFTDSEIPVPDGSSAAELRAFDTDLPGMAAEVGINADRFRDVLRQRLTNRHPGTRR